MVYDYLTYRKSSAFVMLLILYQSIYKGEDEFYAQRTETTRLLKLYGLYSLLYDEELYFTIETIDYAHAREKIMDLLRVLLDKKYDG